jgi:ABC-type polar amino acid transport system ATPase subunit
LPALGLLQLRFKVTRGGVNMVAARTPGVGARQKWDSEVANRVVFMDAGQIIESNTPANFFANQQHARTQLFLSQILR